MRPALRRLRTLPAVLVMAGVVLPAVPLVARADDNDELAGTRAGEGRAHPGRTDEPDAAPPAASVGSTPSRRAGEGAGERREGQREQGQRTPTQGPQGSYEDAYDPADAARTDAVPTGRTLRVLPLGTGLALMGLGLGLAFLGLRLRRQ
ncbi:hypothetical protein SAZ11_28250 [Streptomyces sp. FXJ1.4098]|uniref:hypothetical protein n=1 Tax=Streptomyces sp. NPDC020845 TaxID=3365096 RepID=UPI0029961348|nr:hypothetical protein [Streptomyces sp. FXJ1.4098]